MTLVTRVTGNAVTAEDLTEQDYRDIYDENRKGRSIRQFADLLGSAYSIAWWSKYEHGGVALTRAARGELRRLVGLPALPLTIEQATADVDPDAVVWRIGDEAVDRVLLIGQPGSLTLNVNGSVKVLATDENAGEDPALECVVTGVTRPTARPARKGVSISLALWKRLNAARVAKNLSWADFLARLLEGGAQ